MRFLPDGPHFLFLGRRTPEPVVYVGSLDSRERTPLPHVGPMATFAQGHLFFMRGATLMAQAFDADRLVLRGDAVPIADAVLIAGGAMQQAAYGVSDTGLIVYDPVRSGDRTQLTWFDRAGRPVGTVGEADALLDVALSPDGTRAAVSLTDAGPDVWVVDLRRVTRMRVTFDASADIAPTWSPDGTHVLTTRLAQGRRSTSRPQMAAAQRRGGRLAGSQGDRPATGRQMERS